MTSDMGAKTAVVLLSASGKLFSEQVARRLSQLERVVLICGRYEGVDERVAEHLADDEISDGGFRAERRRVARGDGCGCGDAAAAGRAGE